MNFLEQNAGPAGEGGMDDQCTVARAGFSAYLDGAMSGREMVSLSGHLDRCVPCSMEFSAWRDVQRALSELGPVPPPVSLQAQLREALAEERKQGTYLSLGRRTLLAWKSWMAPMALRLSGGLVAALLLVCGLGWIFGAPISVQANDDRLAHMVAPRYLYSQVPPQPIETRHDVPVVVEAKVNTQGRVYDYAILAGPKDAKVQVQVQNNLLGSIFEPATLFGVPVRGHIVMTYAGVWVHG